MNIIGNDKLRETTRQFLVSFNDSYLNQVVYGIDVSFTDYYNAWIRPLAEKDPKFKKWLVTEDLVNPRRDNFDYSRVGQDERVFHGVEYAIIKAKVEGAIADIDSDLPPQPGTIGFQRSPIIDPTVLKSPRQIGFRKKSG